MTVLWTALIIVGVVMIVAAVWPSVREGRRRHDDKRDSA
jgi:predicted anti-sigma-YlaC factor YlaD